MNIEFKLSLSFEEELSKDDIDLIKNDLIKSIPPVYIKDDTVLLCKSFSIFTDDDNLISNLQTDSYQEFIRINGIDNKNYGINNDEL